MSLLTIIQGAARRANYPQPSVAMASTDPNVLLMIDCAQDTGDEACERWGWQILKTNAPYTFTGDGTTTTFGLPATIETLEPDAVFVSSAYPTLRMIGPVNEDDLLRMKALPMALYPSVWRVADGKVEFFPAPGSGEVISFVGQGNSWITNSGGTQYVPSVWTVDTDLSLLPERLIRAGVIWRWKKSKGLDYAEDMKDYEMILERRSGQEATERVIEMSRSWVTWDSTWPGIIVDNTDQNY